ncbi:MAG TPA: hypothetical protein VFA26_02100 [Gemmataceae bacterium]|nr:hypothetical protein [Gemmataceae bacterium]
MSAGTSWPVTAASVWARPRMGAWSAVAAGLAITVLQITLACLLSGQTDLPSAYGRLFAFDSYWYADVVDYGYRCPPVLPPKYESNVAFFPGYPCVARLVRAAFGLKTHQALLLTAQLSAWAFWTYLLLLLRRWQAPAGLAALTVAAIATHPAAFYLVAGYSEPLFLAAMLGFLYWSEGKSAAARALCAAHGFLMAGTRLVGVAVLIYPFVRELLARRPGEGGWRRFVFPGLAGLVGAAGPGGYFGYCQWRFGRWDMYMEVERVGWLVRPDYLALFSPRIFHIHWPILREWPVDPEFLSRLSVPVTVAAALLFLAAELWAARRLADSGWRFRAGLYLAAAFMFYICVSGHSSRSMSSMIRFAVCVQALLALAAAHLLTRAWPQGLLRGRWAAGLYAVWCAGSFLLQAALTYRFVHGQWVAEIARPLLERAS